MTRDRRDARSGRSGGAKRRPQRAAARLRESGEPYRLLCETTTNVVILVDAADCMVYANPAAERMFGYTPAELIGQPLTVLLPPSHRDAHHQALRRYLETGTRTVNWTGRRTLGMHRDGREFPVEITYSNMRIEGEVIFAGIIRDVSDRERMAAELRESELRFRQLAENIREVFWLTDPTRKQVLYVSPGYEQIWGCSREALRANPLEWVESIHPEDRPRILELAVTAQAPGEYDETYRIVRPDGSIRWIRDRAFPVRDENGAVYRVAGVAEDVTEEKRAERKIRRLNRVYAMLSGINSVIVRTRDRQALLDAVCRIALNQGQFGIAWIGMLGEDGQTAHPVACLGVDAAAVAETHVSAGTGAPEGQGAAGAALRSGKAVVCDDLAQEPEDRLLRAEAIARGCRSVVALPLLHDGTPRGVMLLYAGEPGFFDAEELELLDEIASDVSFGLQYIEKEEQLTHLAYYDALTGLANATLFLDRLAQFLHSARHKRAMVGVLVIDLDRFTRLNDTFGRHTGDALLKGAAERFAAALWEPYSLARLGSDAYAVALPELRAGPDAAAVVHEKLFPALEAPFTVDGREVRLSARAGIALYPGDGEDAATLFKNAEAALRQAQASGEPYLYYAPEINARVAEKLALEARLRQAIEREEFLLHYQPKFDGRDGSVTGLEALIRWQDPQAGLVPPASFVPVLEESGLILEAGNWVIRRALAEHRRWQEAGLRPPRVAVNVSPLQLRRRDFAARLRTAIEESGAGGGALEVEVTETLVMEDVDANIRTLQAIREMGVTIAIDDFGTGYASLRYLARLPVDSIKIDRSFVAGMVDDPDSMSIVSTMISLAHSLSFRVVAEGVEDEELARFLRLLKCDELQGFLFSRPLPAAEAGALLGRRPGPKPPRAPSVDVP